MSFDLVRFHDGERYVCALVTVGRTNLRAVVIDDGGVRVIEQPKAMQRACEPLLLRGRPYPIARMARHFRRVGRERGITKAAEALISQAMTEAG